MPIIDIKVKRGCDTILQVWYNVDKNRVVAEDVIQGQRKPAVVHIRPQSPAHETGAELFGKVMGKSVFWWDFSRHWRRTFPSFVFSKCFTTQYPSQYYCGCAHYKRTVCFVRWRDCWESDAGHPLSVCSPHHPLRGAAVERQILVPFSETLLWIRKNYRRRFVPWVRLRSEPQNRKTDGDQFSRQTYGFADDRGKYPKIKPDRAALFLCCKTCQAYRKEGRHR